MHRVTKDAELVAIRRLQRECSFDAPKLDQCPDYLATELSTASIVDAARQIEHKTVSKRATLAGVSTETVCLVTQCSVDRLSHLIAQATAWRSAMSVAVFVPRRAAIASPSDSAASAAIRAAFDAATAAGCHIHVSLLFGEVDGVPVKVSMHMTWLC